jgi:hypothetical protein
MPPRTLTRIGLSIALDGEAPPSEFRLFKAGENHTTKGVFLFDAKAAVMVMAAATAYANDYAIDLEHRALDQESRGYDPDARGWFNLAVRNGELWAINVRWTPDGARRLSEKTQRYISPAFCTDDENRVTEIVNIALVAMPATHGTPALVAAHRGTRMSVNEAARALAPVLQARLAVASANLVKLADGEGEAAPPGKAASVKAAGEKAAEMIAALIDSFGGSDIDATFAAMGAATEATDAFKAKVEAMMGAAPPPEAKPEPEPEAMAAEPSKEDEEKAVAAAASRLLRLSGTRSIVAAVAEVETWRASHLELETERQKLAAERATLESAERRKGCADLVKLGGLAPAAVWKDEEATAPASYLASMSIGDFRAFVAASTKGRKADPKAPTTATETLSARELAMCAEMKIDPKQYAANKPTRKA